MTPVELLSSFINSTVPELNYQPKPDLLGSISIAEIVIFFVIIAISYVVGKVIAVYLKKKYSHKMRRDRLNLLTLTIQTVIMLIGLYFAAPAMLELSLIFVVIVFGGLILAFAVSSSKIVSDFISGLGLLYEHPVRSGEYIEVGDISGTVEEVRLLSTIVRTDNGVYVRIPNDEMYSTKLNNYYANVARRFDYDVGIRYEDDVGKAIEVLKALFDGYTHILKNPAPAVFVSSFNPSSVNIKLWLWLPSAWVTTIDGASLKTNILSDVKTALEENGIQIAFPQQVVWFGDETLQLAKDRRHL
jgi:small-conductance mechanosensitive channel